MTRLDDIYAHYAAFCAERGIDPALFARWFLLTDSLIPLPRHEVQPIQSQRTNISTGSGNEAQYRPAYSSARNATNEAIKTGLFVGELRPDGSVGVVRHQTDPNSEKSLLTARICRGPCGQFLPMGRFSKQGKSRRSICRDCDNARRRKPKP